MKLQNSWWFFFCGLWSLLALTSCKNRNTQDLSLRQKSDPHSFALVDESKVNHLDLDLEVDFEHKTIGGTATLSLENTPRAKNLVLDTKQLMIEEVTRLDSSGKSETVKFELGNTDPILGQPLTIPIKPSTQQVSVTYQTSPHAEALQWLEPNLTAGKRHPFLLTQSQAINARTWVPIQDGPGYRFTYSAKVTVPEALMAVMSASNPQEKSETGEYRFQMDQPIPAYLLALAVGDIQFKALGPRTGVYAEPGMLDKAAYELEEMEKMMDIAENMYGPYRWDRYDVIILPPSFPFGGMENPRLTFATPTILAGDRSLTSLIAHELAHSWSGNLVTNATWNDFWINEGFTVYFEYRIMEELKGRAYSEMLASLSYQDLVEEVRSMGPNSPETHLKLDLEGQNPDDGVTSIAYDKGYYFLRLVEEAVGRERFDAFLRSYFSENAFKTMTTEVFLARMHEELFANDEEKWSEVRVEQWVYGPGVPKNCPEADPERFQRVHDAMTSWGAGQVPSEIKTDDWSTHEWVHFIRSLPDSLTQAEMSSLDGAFKFTQRTNAEVQCVWYAKAISSRYEPAYPYIEKFLVDVGRRKFLTPLYKAMSQSEEGRKMALQIYEKARPGYHPISYKTIDNILEWPPAPGSGK
ncbi:MAG: M1 family metallopeptidase [Bacteroidota bacterium]